MKTTAEYLIRELYHAIKIYSPEELDMHEIAQRLNVKITYRNNSFRFRNGVKLVRGDYPSEWMMFGHELCHVLRHVGNQLNMHYLFVQLQEYQANYFAYHFCVPTFMIEQIKGVDVYEIMRLFNVDFNFALRRLEMYQHKIISRRTNNGLLSKSYC